MSLRSLVLRSLNRVRAKMLLAGMPGAALTFRCIPFAMVGGAVVLFSTRNIRATSGCVVQGQEVSLDDVVVHAERGTFLADTYLPMKAKLPRWSGGSFELAVGGAVAFSATAKNVWLAVSSPAESKNHLVKMLPGVQVVDAYSYGNEVIGTLAQRMNDCPPDAGMDDRPPVVVRSVRLPCEALALQDNAAYFAAADANSGRSYLYDHPVWFFNADRNWFRLYAEPRVDAASILVSAKPGHPINMDFAQLDQRGGWLKLIGWGWYMSFTGWMPRRDLVPLGEDEPYGEGGFSMCGEISAVGHSRDDGDLPPSSVAAYIGPARVAAGTKVSGDFGYWGEVTEDTELQVRYVEGDEWVHLTSIRGLSGNFLALVAVSAVTFPTKTK